MIKRVVSGRVKPACTMALVYLCAGVLWFSFCVPTKAQEGATLGWNPPTDNSVAGFYLYWGNASLNYAGKIDVGTNISFTLTNLALGSNYFFAVSSYAPDGTESLLSLEVKLTTPSTFFQGEQAMGNGLEWLSLPNNSAFGYYALIGFPWIYHFDMGYEYFFNANDGQNGAIIYDFSSKSFWYTSPGLFPFMYDFSLKSWVYYFPDSTRSGHYTSNPRLFYDFNTKKVISK
jgi:hypothetical protein